MSNDSSLLLSAVRTMLVRDLKSADAQIAAYPDDESLWLLPAGISNSAGSLGLHMAGNLRHFIGAVLGGSGYVRDRDAEFGGRGVSREKIRSDIAAAIDEVTAALDGLDPETLGQPFPTPVGPMKIKVRTSDLLLHLSAHLTYHLGQVDYHRRLLTSDPQPVENLSLRYLGSE